MAPRMSAARKLFQDSPVSFKQQPKNEMARSSTPYRICSSRKTKKLLSKPTLHQAKLNETDASRLSTTAIPKPHRYRLSADHRIILGEDRDESFVLSTKPIGLLKLAQCFPNGFDLFFNVDHMS